MNTTSSIAIFILKWWRKILRIKPNPLITFLYVVLLIIGIYLYRQWTDISAKTIDLDIHELQPDLALKDTVYADICINLNLSESGSRISQINNNLNESLIHFVFQDKNSGNLEYENKNDYFSNITNANSNRLSKIYSSVFQYNKNTIDSININTIHHIIGVDVRIEGIVPWLGIRTKQHNSGLNLIKGSNDFFFLCDSLYTNFTNNFFKPHYISHAGFVYGFNQITCTSSYGYTNSIISTPISSSTPISLLKLEDISQQYIKININKYKPYNNIKVHNVKVNTIGACDIKIKSFSYDKITYCSRMDGIDIHGDVRSILLYIEAKEGVSLQSLRLFFLTTLMTVVLTLFIGSIASSIRNIIKNKTVR